MSLQCRPGEERLRSLGAVAGPVPGASVRRWGIAGRPGVVVGYDAVAPAGPAQFWDLPAVEPPGAEVAGRLGGLTGGR